MSRFVALTCEALARSIYATSAHSPHTISVRLFKQGLHDRPRNLRGVLQAEIDAIPPDDFDAILLVYGICGTSTIGLRAPAHTPLVIPRAHDCITLYLGSKERYQEEFNQHPGTYWYSLDYMERAQDGSSTALGAAGLEDQEARYDEYVQKYGKDNADMLLAEMRRWSQHYTRAAFIDTGLGESQHYEDVARAKAAQSGWLFERKQGDRRLLDMLIAGDWREDEFLVVPPGHITREDYANGLIGAAPPEQ